MNEEEILTDTESKKETDAESGSTEQAYYNEHPVFGKKGPSN